MPLVLTDTAGLRETGAGAVEAIGIARAEEALAQADLVLWLGEAADAPQDALLIAAKADLGLERPGMSVSAMTGEGLADLRRVIAERAKALLPKPGAVALNRRHRAILQEVCDELREAANAADQLIAAEHLRRARLALDALTGKAGVEDMLDALFGSFCIGK